jgi:hypothetical protein
MSGKPPGSDDVNDELIKRRHHIINPPGALAFQLEVATRTSPYIFQTIDHGTAKEAFLPEETKTAEWWPLHSLLLGEVFESIMATWISYLMETEEYYHRPTSVEEKVSPTKLPYTLPQPYARPRR